MGSDRRCRENQNTYFIFKNEYPKTVPFFREYRKCGKTIQVTDDNTRGSMHMACWITKATNIYAEHAILLAFARQQW
jgi:hypothetical protein